MIYRVNTKYNSWNFQNDNIYETILHSACQSGNIELVKYLIKMDQININSTDIILHIFQFNFMF